MDGETLPVDERAHIRIARLLCLLGAILVPLYAPLYGATSADAPNSAWWIHLGVAGLLVALIGASYVSRELRRHHVEITWGLLCFMMVWAAALAALHEFTGAYAVGLLLVYAVFGGLVAVGSASMRPVLAFLLAGALSIGGALLWAPTLQTSPWALGGAVLVVALIEGVAMRWALSVRNRLRAQTRTLREQRDLLDRLVETSPHAVVRVDENGTPIDVSGRAKEILGARAEDFFHPPHDASAGTAGAAADDRLRPVSHVFQSECSVRARECPIEGPDGDQRILSVSGAPVRGPDGGLREAIFHLEDVTDREHRKQALRQAEESAAEADRLKSALLANMNHEIRTPLTAIIGFAEAIGTSTSEMDLPENSPLPGYANLIGQSGKRLLETFEDILDLAQLEAGQMKFGVASVDLAEQARRAVEEYREQAQEGEIDLRLDETDVEARADENGVQVVLQNLLDNAIKYTAEGGTVWVRTYREPEWAVLEVEDTGVGMEPEVVDQLFEPFRQASTGLGREYEGTGVGLAVTKEAATQMGGSVEVKTEAGTGSRFLARFPMTGPGAQDRDDSPAEQLGDTTNPHRNHQKAPTSGD